MVAGLCNQLFFPVKRVPGTLQPSEFLGEFVQADGWARLPVTPLNPGSGKLRRTFLTPRSPHGSSRFEFRIRPETSRRLVIPRTSCWRCSRRLVRAAARPSFRQPAVLVEAEDVNTRGFLASPVQVAHVYKSQIAVDGDSFDLAGYAPCLFDVAHDGIEPIREKRVVLEISSAHETRIQVGLA